MVGNISLMLSGVIPVGGELSVSCVTPLEVCAGFPQILPHIPLLTVGTYAMINHSLEYNHLLSPVSLREFLNLRVV